MCTFSLSYALSQQMRIARYAIPARTSTVPVNPVKYTVRKINSKIRQHRSMSGNTHQYQPYNKEVSSPEGAKAAAAVEAASRTCRFHSPKSYTIPTVEPDSDSDNDSCYDQTKDKGKGSVSTLSTYGNDRTKDLFSFDLRPK
jgi:hypothetical protein